MPRLSLARWPVYSFLAIVLAGGLPAFGQATQEPDYAAELPRIPPTEPADALATFQVLPGFRIEQVAAEPHVASPVAACFDERGRMYVVEMRDYSEQDKEFLGTVRLL